MSFFLGTLILYKSTMEDSCKSCERIVKYIKTKTRLMGYRVGKYIAYCLRVHMYKYSTTKITKVSKEQHFSSVFS